MIQKPLHPNDWPVELQTQTHASQIAEIDRGNLAKLKYQGFEDIFSGTKIDMIKFREKAIELGRYPGKQLALIKPAEPNKDEEHDWGIKRVKYQALREETKYKVEIGELHSNQDCIETFRYIGNLVRKMLEGKLYTELPPKISGKSSSDIAKSIRIVLDEIYSAFEREYSKREKNKA